MQNNKRTISGRPVSFVVFGSTGDLMAKKIAPALFGLHEKRSLPGEFRLIGVGRREWGDKEFQKHLRTILEVKAPDAEPSAIKSFLNKSEYARLEFDEIENYKSLKAQLPKKSDNIFYLSVPPQFYPTILRNIHASGLSADGRVRILIEKPFGADEKSARELDAMLAKFFDEKQIYRIDHYLAKEMLQNILIFRFANDLFESEWNASTVESIHIRLLEKIGVEDRGAFYDKVGTLADVGQNHLLQMLALVTMEKPARYDAGSIRPLRADLLRKLVIQTPREAARNSFRAQYDGYRKIKGVGPASMTETYFRIKGRLKGKRWAGVPIIMESGKRLSEAIKEIEITLKHKRPCLCEGNVHLKNKIKIQLEPSEGIMITFNSKRPGHLFAIEERKLKYHHRDGEMEQGDGNASTHTQYTYEYEKLILDSIFGDQTLFVTKKEIAAMWRFIDPFIAAWKKDLTPLRRYAPDQDAVIASAGVIIKE